MATYMVKGTVVVCVLKALCVMRGRLEEDKSEEG